MGVIQFKGGSIQFKGGTIQFKNLGKVANPTVEAYWNYDGASSKWFKTVKVTNNDTETVSVYTSLQNSGLTFNGVSATSGNYLTYDNLDGPYDFGISEPKPSFTVYVQMKAEGRLDSDIISDEYIDPNKVASPTVEASWGGAFGAWTQLVTVTNNDNDTVSVYASKSSTPTTLQGQLNPDGSSTYTVGGPLSVKPGDNDTFTAYVQLKRDARPDSDIISDVSPTFM